MENYSHSSVKARESSFIVKTLGFWMIVNYHRQNYSHCTPRGLFPSQRRKTEVVKFVFLLTTVCLPGDSRYVLASDFFCQVLLSQKVLNCGIQISVTYNVIQSMVYAQGRHLFMNRRGCSLLGDERGNKEGFVFVLFSSFLSRWIQLGATFLVSYLRTIMKHIVNSTHDIEDTLHLLYNLLCDNPSFLFL